MPAVLKPMAHQKKSLAFAKTQDRIFDVSDAGTGKTAVRLWTFQARHKAKQAKKMLVLAPKTLLRAVWDADAKKFVPALRRVVSTAGNHHDAFRVPADIYITNIDAVKWLAKQPKAFFKDFDELVIDESTVYKHHTSDRSKAVNKIAKHFKYRTCMTGTPNTVSITDVWHQVKILDDGARLGDSFYGFRNAVCECEQVGRSQHALKWTDRPGAEEVVFGMLSDIVIRHKLEDCADIPPNHRYSVSYEMSAAQKRAYMNMEEHMLTELYGSFELAKMALTGKRIAPKKVLTAVHAGALRTKLLQIASGAVYTGVGEEYELLDSSRYEFALDLAEQVKHSIMFFLWRHQRDLLVQFADKRGLKFGVIDGDATEGERNDLVKGYQAGVYDTMFIHPQSGAHGLTLTRGTRAIWVSPTDNLEWFVQGGRRINRLTQTQKTETITILAEGSAVEDKIYNINLAGKDARMSNLLDLFSGAWTR